jgi:hypothetical protein
VRRAVLVVVPEIQQVAEAHSIKRPEEEVADVYPNSRRRWISCFGSTSSEYPTGKPMLAATGAALVRICWLPLACSCLLACGDGDIASGVDRNEWTRG